MYTFSTNANIECEQGPAIPKAKGDGGVDKFCGGHCRRVFSR